MTLTKNEIANQNLDALKDLLLTQIENSTLADQLPPNTHIIILPYNNPDLLTTNLKIAADIIQRMAVGEESQAPVVLLSTTRTGDFIQMPIYDNTANVV